jgi:hypothetical protein
LRYAWQANVVSASRWLDANTPAGARVGAWSAGIPGYLSDRTVVNLDGVVNVDAYEAARSCATLGYLRESGIEYVADVRGAFFFAGCSFDFERDFEQVAVVGADADGTELYIMRVRR